MFDSSNNRRSSGSGTVGQDGTFDSQEPCCEKSTARYKPMK